MGLTAPGQGARAVLEGWTQKDGRLPVNPSGGLKAKGHPIGATGVSMHAITAMQLTGQAPGGMQLPKADIGGGVQHGRRGGRQLRLDPGAVALIPTSQSRASADPDRAAVSRPAGDRSGATRTWTWAEFRARVQAAAGALAARGVRHGDRVLLHARNSNAVLETMFATWMLGAVWVPTNFRLTPPEVAYLATSSGASVHIFDSAFPEHAAAAKAENPACRLEISIGPAALEWDALAGARSADDACRPMSTHDHPAWFFYTSGTTGRPKAGVLTHGQMEYVVCNHLCDLMPATTEHDVSLVVAPLSHGAGVHALPQVARGAATVLLSGERLDCEEAWRLVERHRVTNMFTVPTILTMLTRHDAVDRYDHSVLRYVIYAGAPMYRADQVHALRKLGQGAGAVFRHGRGDRQHHRPAARAAQSRRRRDAGRKLRFSAHRHGGRRSWTTPAIICRLARRARSACAAPASSPATTTTRRRPRRRPRIGWFHTGDLGHMDDARLRLHHRPRVGHVHLRRLERVSAGDRGSPADRIPPSPRPASSACRTRNGAKPASRCWCWRRA